MIINEDINENPLCVYHIIRYTGFLVSKQSVAQQLELAINVKH